jgi:hypothetical protein
MRDFFHAFLQDVSSTEASRRINLLPSITTKTFLPFTSYTALTQFYKVNSKLKNYTYSTMKFVAAATLALATSASAFAPAPSASVSSFFLSEIHMVLK